MRKTPPHSLNLDGQFGKVNTNVWTTEGVISQDRFAAIQARRSMEGRPLTVLLQDKFPRMLDYVAPSGIRVLNPNNVRLGAHLAEGTVVMTAGAVNFNAGTLGEAMVEGRISAGVTVGARSDVGGGASILGTLSGGNAVVVSMGEDCLLEAMSGLGIPVGDRVRVEVGFYVKSTTPILVVDSPEWTDSSVAKPHVGSTVKARELAGISDAVFRRNAITGTPEVVPRGNRSWGKLNPDLHKN
jgi:2,3,4,5-tetrahydropyridine-2-carboxylate N-succinyltransferase